MGERIGDMHLKVVLAGEPATVRFACNERFIPFAERATIRHHWRLRFARCPDHASSGIVDLGKITRDTKADAESALSRVGQQMEARDVAYARRLIDEVHRAIANRAAIEPFGGTHPRFWLAIEVECHAGALLDALDKTTRIATVWDYEASMYVRDGHGQSPVLRSFTGARSIKTLAPEHLTAAIRLLNDMSGAMARANRAREAVVEVRARAVLEDLADDWLANGSAMNYTPWRSFVGGNDYWLDMVELEFLAANLEKYRELRKHALEREADRKPEMPLSLPRDQDEAGPGVAIAPN
jgi:hypothetical protein